MTSTADSPLPNDVATLQTMLLSERAAARMAAESEAKFRALLIEKLKYTIAKLRHDKFGQSSERGAILEQLELSLAECDTPWTRSEGRPNPLMDSLRPCLLLAFSCKRESIASDSQILSRP